MILYIKKRDGQKVLFNPEKIANAIRKAFLASAEAVTEAEIEKLTKVIAADLESKYSGASYPSVEHTQDIVENVLMRSGHLDTAKSYIRYRALHSEAREQKTLDAIREQKLQVVNRQGVEVPFNPAIVASRLLRLSKGLDFIDLDELNADICRHVYNSMPLSEVEETQINAARTRIEKHYNYAALAARMVADKLYREILDAEFGSDIVQQEHSIRFAQYVRKGVDLELLDPELLSYDLVKIGNAVQSERDLLFRFLGMQTIYDRYLLRDRSEARSIFELPQWMWMRVAMGLALNEKREEREDWAIRFYNELSQMNVVSSTPTLFNSGTTHPQMSSCYLNTVDDSLTGIFKTYSDCALLSKWAGGIGTNWSSVRAKNAFIKGTNGRSQGVVPFLKIFNDVALAVNQGGKRKGAMAAYMDFWHSDLEEFLELKKNTGDERRRTHDIHTAVLIPDLFMKRVREKGKWTLFTPDQVPDLQDAYGKSFEEKYAYYESLGLSTSRTLDALDIWRKLLTMLFETGHPWITFKDSMNVRSPQDHVGVVRNSNLCTEITLNTSKDETAVCNLASINLARMVDNGQLDEVKLRHTVTITMRMLDNVVENNFYPIPEAKTANMRHRPVGLGMMGYADALYQLEIDFDSEENLDFADYSMEIIAHAAIYASSQLAAERGTYQSYLGSKWDRGLLPLDTLNLLEKERGVKIPVSRVSKLDWEPVRASIKAHGMRNSNCMAIAPTATISNIAGTVPCVEPTFKNLYMKENLSGNFLLINTFLVDALQKEGLWTPEILTQIKLHNGSVLGIDAIPAKIRHRFKETFELDTKWILESAARRAKWIDQSASTNIFMKTTSGKILSETYQYAWELGLKTTYYLRTQAASQVTKMVDSTVIEQKGDLATASTADGLINEVQTFKACSITDPDCEACQ